MSSVARKLQRIRFLSCPSRSLLRPRLGSDVRCTMRMFTRAMYVELCIQSLSVGRDRHFDLDSIHTRVCDFMNPKIYVREPFKNASYFKRKPHTDVVLSLVLVRGEKTPDNLKAFSAKSIALLYGVLENHVLFHFRYFVYHACPLHTNSGCGKK